MAGGRRPGRPGIAVAALIVAIVGIFIPLLGIVALILGIIAKRKVKKEGYEKGGGMAIVAIVLGVIGIIIGLLIVYAVLYVWVTGFEASGGSSPLINGYFNTVPDEGYRDFQWEVVATSGEEIEISSLVVEIEEEDESVVAHAHFTQPTAKYALYHAYEYETSGGSITIHDNNMNGKLDTGDSLYLDPIQQNWDSGDWMWLMYQGERISRSEFP